MQDRRFVPRRFAAKGGRQLRLVGDDERHQIAIERLGVELPLEPHVTLDIAVPSRKGRYRLVCRLHRGMDAVLVVR